MQDKKKLRNADSAILELVDSVSPAVGKLILNEYNKMPYAMREAIKDFYAALDDVADKDSIGTIQEALNKLRNVCDANPAYKDVYEAAKREAQNEIAEVVANEGMALFENE